MTQREVYKELYRFVEGDSGAIYTVTNADETEVYDAGDGAETYAPVEIGRDEAVGKGNMERANVTISFALSNERVMNWFTSSLDFPITVTIFSKDEETYEVEWKGRLASVTPEKSTLKFVFESVFTSMRRMGLRQRYQITCPYSLYGDGCGLDKEDFDTSGAITNVTNNVVTFPAADAFADGYFNAGIFEDNVGNLRFITSHVGDQLTLIRPMNPLLAYIAENGYTGLTGRIFPGCDRSTQTCNDKFNNLLNHGGFPFMPNKNPFSGSSIA